MRSSWRLLALSSLLVAGQVAAQNLPITALPFLEIPPSPAINAMGGAGVALPSADPHAFLFNPAQLGIAARDVQAAGTLYPDGTTDWLAVGDLTVGSTALTAGVDLREWGLPFAAGIGLGRTALNFSERVIVNELGEAIASYQPRDRYHALSLGFASVGAARIGVGATTRYVTSTDRATMNDERLSVSNIHGMTIDIGILAEADVSRLAGHPTMGPFQPDLSVAVGYAQSSIGGAVGYSGQFSATALPRTARLGWSASGGLSLPFDWMSLQVVHADVSIQAEHLLVREQGGRTYSYEAFLGNLDVVDNALLGRGSADVTARRGFRIAFMETLAISRGGFDGWGFQNVRTNGLEFRLAGPLKVLGELTNNARLTELADRYDVRLTRAVYFEGESNASTFTGISFFVKR